MQSELFVVEYQDRDPESGNYIVKNLTNGEIVSVPSQSAIYILKLDPGQKLILVQPTGETDGYLLPPI